MELLKRIADSARRDMNNPNVINFCLVAAFAFLGAKSWHQENNIRDLEVEKESLVKSNKAIRKTIWDWKQQLYDEAASGNTPVPLERLKAIYGEAPPPTQSSASGNTAKQDAKTSVPTKIII